MKSPGAAVLARGECLRVLYWLCNWSVLQRVIVLAGGLCRLLSGAVLGESGAWLARWASAESAQTQTAAVEFTSTYSTENGKAIRPHCREPLIYISFRSPQCRTQLLMIFLTPAPIRLSPGRDPLSYIPKTDETAPCQTMITSCDVSLPYSGTFCSINAASGNQIRRTAKNHNTRENRSEKYGNKQEATSLISAQSMPFVAVGSRRRTTYLTQTHNYCQRAHFRRNEKRVREKKRH